MPTRRDLLAAAGTAAAGGLAGCFQLGASSTGSGSSAETGTATATAAAEDLESARGGAATEVYEATLPSVVGVNNYGPNGPQGSGSGFVAGDGYVVTNQHVVDDATEVRLRFQQNTWREAEIVGTDAYSDLAVLRAESRPEFATPLKWVETDPEPPVGTPVIAIGTPFGYRGSASAGVISGVNRVLSAPNNYTVADAVQTDAALNPGNSGGPIVTYDGRVAAVAARGGGDNIGFGISAALSKRVVPALASEGEYDHPLMGVRLTEVTPLIAEAYGLQNVGGVLIVDILEDGPAVGHLQGADGDEVVDGVQVPTGGDIVVRLENTDTDAPARRVRTQADLSTYLALNTSPGDAVAFTVVRDGERTTVTYELGERPEPNV